ncbi:MAG TPA: Rap1a/Tai family immunity protein [Nitrospirota bacterium]|nr:Rap1a/Tai family immunity protein [Nitrospirota bacterium]
MKKLLVVSIMLILPSISFGYTGNELLRDCGLAIRGFNGEKLINADHEKAGVCLGYVEAIVDEQRLVPTSLQFFCIPSNITYEQDIRIIVKYLNDHPEQLKWDANALIKHALDQAFPCKKGKIRR